MIGSMLRIVIVLVFFLILTPTAHATYYGVGSGDGADMSETDGTVSDGISFYGVGSGDGADMFETDGTVSNALPLPLRTLSIRSNPQSPAFFRLRRGPRA